MKNWKSWLYWQKGGVAALGVYLIVLIGIVTFAYLFGGNDAGGAFLLILLLPFVLPGFIVSFLIGMAFGEMYGKFKNRNLNTGTPHQSTTTPPRE